MYDRWWRGCNRHSEPQLGVDTSSCDACALAGRVDGLILMKEGLQVQLKQQMVLVEGNSIVSKCTKMGVQC